MRILIILTGGTIGSRIRNGSIDTDETTKYSLTERYESVHGKTDFEFSEPYRVLSENLSACELNLLQSKIADNLEKGYDGIIVSHGTDTLQYSAVAAEYAFADCGIPVVFVSSDYPLEDEKANGHFNFEAAVEFIKSKSGNGVYISYKNSREKATNIHVPSEILQYPECSADILSISGIPYAYYDGKITLCREKTPSGKGLGAIEYAKNSGILVIDSRPGDSFGYSLDGVKAVIFKPYHSATLNTASVDFQKFCIKAKNADIPVFAVNVKSDIGYKSAELFGSLGIIPLPYGTYIAAYMKIWAAVSLGKNPTDFALNN